MEDVASSYTGDRGQFVWPTLSGVKVRFFIEQVLGW
jgi:hypothetical protein